MRSFVRWSILVACLLFVQTSAITAATPQAVQVQVRLQDALGNPVPNGLHSLILTGWDDSTGGILLWTQNQMVTTQQGLTQCFIESPAAAAMLAHSGQQYIQVQVSGEAPLLPRIRLGSVPSALLTTRMDGDVKTLPGELRISPPGSGDPDFDLLRITAVDSAATIHVGSGDPDFDLLRISTTPQSSSISMAGGDPDFDLLRITASDSAANLHMGGDPDFDLLRISTLPSSSSISMSGGDPDFDLLRITASGSAANLHMGSGDPDFDLLRISTLPSSSSISMAGGDPDFDLLRITASDSAANLHMGGGDPDFDLLRLSTLPSSSSISMAGGDPDFDLLRITADPTGSSIAMNGGGDPDFDLLRVSAAAATGSITVGSGDPDFDLLRITGSPAASSIVLNPGSGDPDFDLLRIVADSTGGSISIDEPGVHLSIDCRETTTGLDVEYRIGNDLDGDGVPDGNGIAIDEEGHQRLKAFVDNGGVVIVLDGQTSGDMQGGVITTGVDSTGGSIAIDEEGVQVVRVQSGTSGSGGGGGGGGGGEIAIGEEGVQIVRISSDSTGSTMSVESHGVPGAVLSVSAAGKKYNYYDAFPCGIRDVEIGTLGMTMSCTPGGTTTPDTAVQIDPEGHMMLAGDLTVGGDICAVGTIGACSDARYKTDVAALQGALASIGRMRGVNFNWRTEEFPEKGFRTDRDFGFIAQELKEVIPQVVTLGKDGYYSVDYGRLTPLLVEAVKELEARVASVEAARQAEVSALNDRLARLEAQFAKLAAGTSAAEKELAQADAK